MKIFISHFRDIVILAAVMSMLLLPDSISSQESIDRSIQVHKIAAEIAIDGSLDEEVWVSSDAADQFWQYFPTDSIRSIAPTEIKMAYDENNLYLGITCYTEGNDYVVPSLKRDYRAGGNDNITLLFDPFNDGANAFFFGINPYGVKREGLISGGGTVLGGFSTSWDNVWSVETVVHDKYWVAEVAIPFSSLRFNPGSKEWRFNSYRFDMQTNERSTWMQIPRNQWIFSLGYMGTMEWEEALTSSGSKVTVIPYATAGLNKDYEAGTPADRTANIGGDAKIAITSGLNLDLTVNPDFSQVEVDRQITDLSRFEIFFPERRQFFLENADLFGSNGFGNINPFFSRRIGVALDTITETTVQNTIYGGARLSGKLNNNWRLGLMNMQTAADDVKGIPGINYSVASVQRKIGARSFLSLIGVNKHTLNYQDNESFNQYNRVIGADFTLASADNKWNGKTFLHTSFSPGESESPIAHGTRLEYRVRRYQLGWNHEYVGADYNAEVGFVRRRDYRSISPSLELFFYPSFGPFNRHGPEISMENIWQGDEGLTDQTFSLGWNAETTFNSRIFLTLERNYIFLFGAFDPTGTGSEELAEDTEYTYYNFQGFINTDNSKVISASFRPYIGQYFDGKRFGLRGNINYRFQPYLAIALDYNYNRFDMNYLDEVKSTFLLGPRVDLTLSKSVFLTTFLQYNSQSQNTNINARFQWRFAPVSDFFIVWADNYFTGNDPADRFAVDIRNRSLVAKFTYWLNL